MWQLFATAAAGLEAGGGIYSSLLDIESASFAVATTPISSNTSMFLSSTAAAAAFAAYLGTPSADRDPAWLTCALVASLVPLWKIISVSPAKQVLESAAFKEQSVYERESWMNSWRRRRLMETGLAVTSFGCMVLVLGSSVDDE